VDFIGFIGDHKRTVSNMKEDIVIAMKAGVNNYVTKPFDPKTIKEKIDKVLNAL